MLKFVSCDTRSIFKRLVWHFLASVFGFCFMNSALCLDLCIFFPFSTSSLFLQKSFRLSSFHYLSSFLQKHSGVWWFPSSLTRCSGHPLMPSRQVSLRTLHWVARATVIRPRPLEHQCRCFLSGHAATLGKDPVPKLPLSWQIDRGQKTSLGARVMKRTSPTRMSASGLLHALQQVFLPWLCCPRVRASLIKYFHITEVSHYFLQACIPLAESLVPVLISVLHAPQVSAPFQSFHLQWLSLEFSSPGKWYSDF